VVKNDKNAFEIAKSKYNSTALQTEPIVKILETKKTLIYKYSLGNASVGQKFIEFFDNNFLLLATIETILLVGGMVNLYTNYKLINQYENKTALLLSTQKYATHQVQLKYIMDNLLDLDSKQKQFRVELNSILAIQSDETSFLASAEYDESYWYIKVQAPSKEAADKLLSSAQFKFINKEDKYFTYEKKR
jgi:hypothetical protein